MNLADKFAEERRARLAAERLLELKQTFRGQTRAAFFGKFVDQAHRLGALRGDRESHIRQSENLVNNCLRRMCRILAKDGFAMRPFAQKQQEGSMMAWFRGVILAALTMLGGAMGLSAQEAAVPDYR